MLIFFLILGLTISIGFSISAFILIRILLNRIKTYETWVVETRTEFLNTVTLMRAIDDRGSFATGIDDRGKFECNDEVGQVFKNLLNLIEDLNKKIR